LYGIGLSKIPPEHSIGQYTACSLFPSFACCRERKLKSALKGGDLGCGGDKPSTADCLSVLGVVSVEDEEIIEKKEVRFSDGGGSPGRRRVSPGPGSAPWDRVPRSRSWDATAMWDRDVSGARPRSNSLGNRSPQSLGSSPKGFQRFAQRVRSNSPFGQETPPASPNRGSRSPGRRISQLVAWAKSPSSKPTSPQHADACPSAGQFLQSPRNLPCGLDIVDGDMYDELWSSAVDAAAAAESEIPHSL